MAATGLLIGAGHLPALRFRVRNTSFYRHRCLRVGAGTITVDADQRETLAAWLRHLHTE